MPTCLMLFVGIFFCKLNNLSPAVNTAFHTSLVGDRGGSALRAIGHCRLINTVVVCAAAVAARFRCFLLWNCHF
jgi:hypothetical protein